MSSTIHVQDRGTTIRVTVKKQDDTVQVLSNHTISFLFTKPPNHDTIYSKSGTITSSADGLVEYTIESGFFDVPGTWQMQLQVISGASQWYSNISKLHIEKNII